MSDVEKTEDPVLTDAHKAWLLLNYAAEGMTLTKMTQHVSGNPKGKGVDKWGRAIRTFLGNQGLQYETSTNEKIGELDLTADQEEYIKGALDRGDRDWLEMARTLFANPKLTRLHRESRAVYKYVQIVAPTAIPSAEETCEDEYRAPTTIKQLIHIVNKHVPSQRKDGAPVYQDGALKPQDEKNLTILLGRMRNIRIRSVMNLYKHKIDRDTFESTFIGMVHDQPDLLRHEEEQFISLAAEYVVCSQIDRNIQLLDQKLNEGLDNASSESYVKLSMSLVEALNSARERQDKSKERIKKLTTELTGSRKDKLKNKIEANANVLRLVEAWMTEEGRMRDLELAERQKDAERNQLQRLRTMDDVMALIGGVTEDELY